MNFTTFHAGHITSRRQQRGMVSILIAIIVLVVSLLAAVALMRSVDTSNAIAGSMAFRQEVLQEASRAYDDAKINITYSEPASDDNQTTLGYYSIPQTATIRPNQDIPNVLVNAVSGSSGVVELPVLTSSGNQVFYVVERLCPIPGPAGTGPTATNNCVAPGAVILGGSASNQTKDNGPPFSSGVGAAFRLTVKVVGLRGALAYVQTVMR